ncbi:MAG TPA: tetratricopeptide repeat protein, partial [Solirubrobacteraceae bacterium]|nr:tetratricopeptide repeat protein [Solirubrobacteraceae bacterium]
ARDADPRDPAVMRLLTTAFWNAGNLPAAARAVRDWARLESARPLVHRTASRIYEDMGALSLAVEAADRAVQRAPGDGSAWARLGRLRLRTGDRSGALAALERARLIEPTVEALLDLALAQHLAGDLGAEVSACEQATLVDPDSPAAWSRYAHALARTDRVSDTLAAAERALALAEDPEVRDLLERVRDAQPRGLQRPAAA